jgi:GTP-binding protein HflX
MAIEKSHTTATAQVRAAVVHVNVKSSNIIQDRYPEAKLEEAINLTAALGVKIVSSEIIHLPKVNAGTFLGKGKMDDIATLVEAKEVGVVIVNNTLSPTQQRNLEVAWNAKVLDRPALILEIFADRAQTKAGKLQVEMAQIQYQQNRLVRAWTHLERQRGGIGKTGGPGERQLELDRRMLNDRLVRIKRELTQVEKERELQRKSREKAGVPVVSLVGYTNAGKSTVFNALTGAREQGEKIAMEKDMLFATLDTLMRKITLPSGREVVISDTVGFVSDLPHQLVEAFKATLEEVTYADLLLHVQDISNPELEPQRKDVEEVLKSIHADKNDLLNIGNKKDMADEERMLPEMDMLISAVTGEGIAKLLAEIDEKLAGEEKVLDLQISAADGKKLAWLHQNGRITKQELDEDMWNITVALSIENANRFQLL